jgi:hypothetical protein
MGPWLSPRKGSLADLARALPYVVMDEMPPRRVLNDALSRGLLDAGMSGECIWKAFEIENEEFQGSGGGAPATRHPRGAGR